MAKSKVSKGYKSTPIRDTGKRPRKGPERLTSSKGWKLTDPKK